MSEKHTRDIRFTISIALFLLSLCAAVAITISTNRSSEVWVAARAIPVGDGLDQSDLKKVSVRFGHGADGYIAVQHNIIGRVTQRDIAEGEVLHHSSLLKVGQITSLRQVSFPVRSSDLPINSSVGRYVSIFQIHDVRTGEGEYSPIQVIKRAFISNIDRKSNNINSDLIVSILIPREFVPVVLQSTSSGRLVLVGES